MLHKQRSNNKSQWKFALLMPILLAFIFVFNTKIIAQEKDKAKKIVKINVDVFSMGITKESSKKDLENISNTFLDKGLKVKFSNIKRNNDNEIIAININAKAKNGKAAASHASELENGINPIQISFDNENNNLSIGSNSDHNLTGYTYSKKSKGNSFVFISDQEDDKNTWVTTTGSKKIIIETDFDENDDDNNTNEVIKITTKNDESNKKIVISSNNDKEPLIILDGKEITKKEMDNLDTDAIKSINVYKGAKAIKKYGEKAVNGVIVINKK